MSTEPDKIAVVVAVTHDPASRLLTLHRKWIQATMLESATPIVVDLGDSGEVLYSPHPEGGWVSPPYETIRALAESGVRVSRTIEVCECQDKENADESHLRRFGHDRNCQRFVSRQQLSSPVHRRGGPVSGGPGDGQIRPVRPDAPKARSPIDDGDAPSGGVDSRKLETLTYALVGSPSRGDDSISIGRALRDTNAGPGVDESIVARQLAAAGVSACPKCGAWMQFNNCGNCE